MPYPEPCAACCWRVKSSEANDPPFVSFSARAVHVCVFVCLASCFGGWRTACSRGNTGALLKSFLRRFVRLHGMIFAGRAEVRKIHGMANDGARRAAGRDVSGLSAPSKLLFCSRDAGMVCLCVGGCCVCGAFYGSSSSALFYA